jgi:hypothetical protein
MPDPKDLLALAERLNMDGLSDDAKAIAGCWFGKMKVGGESALTLMLRELKPAPRTQAALDELVNRGAISVEPFNRFGGLVYKPLVDCHDAFVWFMKNAKRPDVNFRLMVPVETALRAAAQSGGEG